MHDIITQIMIAIRNSKRKNTDIVQVTIPALESILEVLNKAEKQEKILKIIKRNLVVYGDGFDATITMEQLNRHQKSKVKDFACLLDFIDSDKQEMLHLVGIDKELELSVMSYHHCPRCGANITDEMSCDKHYCGNCGQKIKYDKEEKKDGE